MRLPSFFLTLRRTIKYFATAFATAFLPFRTSIRARCTDLPRTQLRQSLVACEFFRSQPATLTLQRKVPNVRKGAAEVMA